MKKVDRIGAASSRLMDHNLATVEVRTSAGDRTGGRIYTKTWEINIENMEALTDLLNWAKNQRLVREKQTEISRGVHVKKGKG